MKKLKFYLIILLITSLAFNQDQNFDKSIKDTEEQIRRLKDSINSGNKEVDKLKYFLVRRFVEAMQNAPIKTKITPKIET